MPQFKHLTDDFPKPPIVPLHSNDFDYSRWDNLTAKLKLVNVPWDIEYNNVVEFATTAARDLYLDGLAGYSVELSSGFRNIPGQYVKIPIPYANSMQYNYCIIDYPIPPDPNKPIDYAINPIAYRRMLYFIMDTDDTSPSTTRVLLELDTWQMFIKAVELKNLMLERGHYAVAHSATISNYLKNPITHTDWLLEPELFDIQQTKKGSQVISINPTSKDYIVCFFMPIEISSLADFNAYLDKSYYADTSPTFDAAGNLTSHILNAMTADDGYNPVIQDAQNQNNINGFVYNTMYCVYNSEFQAFISLLKSGYNYLLNNIKQFYVVSSAYVEPLVNSAITISTNIHLYKGQTVNTRVLQVNLETFFATYAATIHNTKLLTSPYTTIEYIYPNGEKVTIETQSCSATIDLNFFLYFDDALRLRTYLQNINYLGHGDVNVLNYASNTSSAKDFIASEITGMYHDIDVPMFYIKINPEAWNKFEQSADRTAKDAQIACTYDNILENQNNDYGNKLSKYSTDKAISDLKTNTSYSNALDNNATTQAVNDNNAYTNEHVAFNTIQTTYDNITRSNAATSANSTAQQGMNTSIAAANAFYNGDMNLINISRNMTATQASNDLQNALIDINAESTTAQSVVGAVSHGLSGDLVGGVLSAASTAIGIVADAAKAQAIVTNNSGMYNASTVMDTAATGSTNTLINDKVTAQNSYLATSTYNTVTASDTNALASYNTDNTNATDIYTAQVANNAAIKTTGDNNALRANTADLNINASVKTLNDAIAGNDYNTALDIAQHNTATEYIKNNLSVTKASFEPIKYLSEFNYQALNQNKGQVIHVFINGLKDDCLKRIDDFFTRYGYAAGGRVIDASVLQVMKYYTYVQARDVIVKPVSCSAKQAKYIRDILLRGCTVYSDPANIGAYFNQDV